VRLVVPFPAGGSIDFISRVLAEALQPRLGRTIVVENRVGAGGNVGAEALARAAPDGDTLGALPANLFTINRHEAPWQRQRQPAASHAWQIRSCWVHLGRSE
jgi:tripartite-type tricarboxylate transporter receptor subunit TctC